MSVVLIFVTLLIFLLWHVIARYDAQRQAMARGESTRYPPAETQPQSSQEALILPCTFRINVPWRSFWILSSIVSLVIGTSAGVIELVADSSAFVVVITIGASIAFCFALLFAIIVALRQKMDITQEGIILSQGGRKQVVRWEEARIFLLPQTQGNTPPSLPEYELASRRNLIRWSYFPVTKNQSLTVRPDLPTEEYNHIIDALNAYVVARTGLTLYDLRGS